MTVSYRKGAPVEEIPASTRGTRGSKYDPLLAEVKALNSGIFPFEFADEKTTIGAMTFLKNKGVNVTKRGQTLYVHSF